MRIEFQKAVAQREIGGWVLDEAHCLSKWGHDFRPDYRYVGRFIEEHSTQGIAPVLCLTATAKPEVISDMLQHFKDKLGLELALLDGGAERNNLTLEVRTSDESTKKEQVFQLIQQHINPDNQDGAIVYCATKKNTEELAEFLRIKQMAAEHFHAALGPEKKKDVQTRFIKGELKVITATNAFGMGIDKPDVRLVIHADIPGSLENYLQEVGRAGRDQQPAHCVLLYTQEDVERQFSMSARSRLNKREIQAILRALRDLDKKRRKSGKGKQVVATPGEILAEDDAHQFERDQATDDTRVKTAIAWLEEAHLLSREENQVQVFPSSLRVQSYEEAEPKIKRQFQGKYAEQLLQIVECLINADADEGVSTDDLMLYSGLDSNGLRAALSDLERIGIANNDTALTAYVHVAVERSSKKRYQSACLLEQELINLMREQAPDLSDKESVPLHLRLLCQHLKNQDHPELYPAILRQLLKGLAMDGRDNATLGNTGSISIKTLDPENLLITMGRKCWGSLDKTALLRRQAAGLLLDHLIAQVPTGTRGVDLLVETTLGKLQAALDEDQALSSELRESIKCLEYALLWLHEMDIIRLNKGLVVFRPAMTIQLDENWRRSFTVADFEPLKLHYAEQVIQIHVMAEYVQRGLSVMGEALQLIRDYFKLSRTEFLNQWLPDKKEELKRQTTPESWQNIVGSLGNKSQTEIVADPREDTNVLVLAGPGSGKTRVLVHRIAYLIRVQRENPKGIIALAYNRHAALQIRQRLFDLIKQDSYGVTILTLHALAMRLVGVSFAENPQPDRINFDQLLQEATALLRGDGLLPEEADSLRDHLLAGFRWILVDEYQDINQAQYELISALAGRSLEQEDSRLNLFAVGDDDQNIYEFTGASSEYIRQFEQDYNAKPSYLIENYRSSANIIAASNAVITPAAQRMKAEHPITINAQRHQQPAGGAWEKLDSIAQGKVQLLPVSNDPIQQAMQTMQELQRLAKCDPEWDWSNTAVIARHWDALQPVYNYCRWQSIPVTWANSNKLPFWQQRDTQHLINWARQHTLLRAEQISRQLDSTYPDHALLIQAVEEYQHESNNAELPAAHFIEWLIDWGRDIRHLQPGLTLTTAHSAKGLEFDHVAILDQGWLNHLETEIDSIRRLYYVAMTRARHTLLLTQTQQTHPLHCFAKDSHYLYIQPAASHLKPHPCMYRQYWQTDLKQINLSYAGRFASNHPIHQRIAQLHKGSALTLHADHGRYYLLDCKHHTVGLMSQAFQLPRGVQQVHSEVDVILIRHEQQHDIEKYGDIRCEQWEIIVPRLVFG